MNPNYNLIKIQLAELTEIMAHDPSKQNEYIKVLNIEKNVFELYNDFEQVAKNLSSVLGKRDQYNADAAYYRTIMKNVQADETLMSMWTDLLMTMKLTNPEIEEELRTAAAQYINLK